MAKPTDAKIEQTLRKIVWEALKNEEEVTVTVVRNRTEEKLGLDTGLLRGGAWKDKSKAIIHAAFEEPAVEAEPPVAKVKESASKPQERSKKSDELARPASNGGNKAMSQLLKRPETTAPQVNGVKRKAAEIDSGPSTSSGGGASSVNKATEQSPSKKAKTDTPSASKRSSGSEAASSSSSEESSDGEDDSGSGSSTPDGDEVQSTPTPAKPAKATQEESIQAIPSKTFKPPSGYTAIDPNLLATTDAFSSKDLEGKQLWHITAPANVPLSSLSELALSSIQSGEPVLSHKNVSYVLSEDKTMGAETTAVLAASAQGYHRAPAKISRTLHLQQKIELPNLSALQASQVTGSNAAGDIAQAAVSTVRPQPKGLRMRFKPPGFGKGMPGRIGSGSESGDDEDEESGPSFQFPKTLGQHGVEVRQDGDVEMVDAATVEDHGKQKDKTEKKAKKKRKEKGSGDANGDVTKVNGVSNAETTGEKVLPTEQSAHGEAPPNGNGVEKESKEEKKRRKEEKKARKEAKAKAKGTVL